MTNDEITSRDIEVLAGFDFAHTRLTNLKPGAYRPEPRNIVIADGTREIIGCDMGGLVDLGSLKITDPAVLDELASWATYEANQLRTRQARIAARDQQ